MKRLLPLLAFVAVLFTGCPDLRETVNFDTDPRVLRGSWDFVVIDTSSGALVSTQAVVFTPTFASDSRYTVTASVTLEGETYALGGTVNGRDLRFVRPQTRLMPAADIYLTGRSSAKPYNVSLPDQIQLNGRWRFVGVLSSTENGVKNFQRLEIIRN